LSFTAAARELNVTQTAVSHQIRALESELGQPLFRRLPRRLALTAAGEAWASELRGVFNRLQQINQRLRRPARPERQVVAVSTIPSFGSRWLVPRLGRFLAEHPDVDLRISASEQLVDFAFDPIDLCIRYGAGRYPGLSSEKLAEDAWVVVCSVAYPGRHQLKSPRDLGRHALLHDDYLDAWPTWFAAVGVPVPRSPRYLQLTDSSMLVEGALRSQGIALARRSLTQDEVAAGRLVEVFPGIRPLPIGLGYYLVAPHENFQRAEIAAFRDWVRAEAVSLRD